MVLPCRVSLALEAAPPASASAVSDHGGMASSRSPRPPAPERLARPRPDCFPFFRANNQAQTVVGGTVQIRVRFLLFSLIRPSHSFSLLPLLLGSHCFHKFIGPVVCDLTLTSGLLTQKFAIAGAHNRPIYRVVST